jgi:ABC-2 type transport system permease protein
MVGLGLAFWSGIFVLSCRVLIHFQSAEVIGDLLAQHLLSMIFLTLFSLLAFSHIITALSNLFLSRDLLLCHATPAPLESLFLSRAAYTFMDSSWMLVIFGVPVFMAYAYVYRAGPLFFFNLIHLSLAMALIAGGIGILVTMVLVYVFPAQRTRDIIMLLSVAMLISLYFLLRFMRPERLVNPDAFFTIMQYMGALKTPQSPYLPTQWITDTLWASLTGSADSSPLFNTALTWTTAASMVFINVWAARLFYFEGFSKSQEAKKRRMGASKVLDVLVDLLSRPFSEDLRAVIAKDVRAFFRDNTQWSQLLLLGALVVVYIYNFSVLPLDKSPMRLDFLLNELAFLNMGLAGFVLSAVAARFAFTAVSAEGESYWVIRSSPIGLKRYLWGKYFFFLLPLILLGEVLILGTNTLLGVSPFMMVLTTITTFLMVFGIVALGIGFGALYPNFRYQNIAQVATGFGGVLYMIVSAIYIAVVIVLEAGPVYILFMSDVRGRPVTPGQWVFIALCFVAVIVITLGVIFKPMQKGITRLEAYEL